MAKPYTYSVTVISFFILCVIALLYTAQRGVTNILSIQAKNGAIDISTAIEKDQSVNLNGEWLFFYNEFLSIEQIKARHSQGQPINVPAYWNLEQFDAQANSDQGYGTYYLQVTIGKTAEPLAISLPTIGTAYRLYVDNELSLFVGEAGRTKAQTTGAYQPQILLLTTDKTVIDLTFHVANYDYNTGGIWYSIKMGKVQTLFQEQKLSSMHSMLLGGFLLAIALYNLILFTQRKSDTLPLVFALLCLTLGLREFFVQNYLILNYLPNLTLAQLVRIEYFTFFLAAPLIIHFNYLIFSAYFNKRVVIASYGTALLLTLMLVIQKLESTSTILLVMQLLTPLYIAYVLLITAQACHAQQKGAQALLFGSFVFAFCVINDILYAHEFIQTGYFSSLGLTIYVLSQSYMTGIKFNQGFVLSNHLGRQLKRRNLALEKMILYFEKRVIERTNALAQANTHLQQLAHTDSLTQTANRHGIYPVIEQEEARFKRNGIPYSLATLDLDHFKDVNDQHGHEAGDIMLKECVLTIQKHIRDQDKLARWGGEEFIVLLPETKLHGAAILAEKIRKAIAQLEIKVNGTQMAITATIGVVEVEPGESFDATLKRSDIALFKGKAQGRNKVVW
ncbi:MAG: diguanylate cyclase (GGDEF)-like protein [Psychromonas sp.]|jgi:diguanylate cyclase (GGDEF)-like protein|uniref:sensor domain-containing diguanylate cyclase n=1 Tax=Psychromonas sp. TaxID=1884585 RepID=UPI0039E5071D